MEVSTCISQSWLRVSILTGMYEHAKKVSKVTTTLRLDSLSGQDQLSNFRALNFKINNKFQTYRYNPVFRHRSVRRRCIGRIFRTGTVGSDRTLEAGPNRFPRLHLRRYRNHSIGENISVFLIIQINRQTASSFNFQSRRGSVSV